MKSMFGALKPTPLLVVVLALIMFAQWVHFSQRYVEYDLSTASTIDATTATYGLGAPVIVTKVNGDSTSTVRYFRLVVNLVTSYVLAVLLARLLKRFALPLMRPGQLYGAVAAVMIFSTFLFSIGWSKSYWGYYFMRPSILSDIHEFVVVNAIVPLKMEAENKAPHSIGLEENYDLAASLANAAEDPYYALDRRLLPPLNDKGLLPASPTKSLASLPELYPLFMGTGLVAPAEEEYAPYNYLRGVAIDGRDASGMRLLILGLSAGQVSDDHFPYYELLFTAPTETSDLSFVRGQRFFFDRAGLEGFEWYTMCSVLMVPLTVTGLFAMALASFFLDLFKRFGAGKREGLPAQDAEGSEAANNLDGVA